MAKKKFHRNVLYFILRFLMALAGVLPYRIAVQIGAKIGRFGWNVLLPRERKRTLEHLRLGFGTEKSDEQLHRIGRAMFDHFGRTLAEWVKASYLVRRLDEYVTAEGTEHVERALSAGKGVVIVAAHFGNWELMAGYTAMKGYPCSVVARKIYLENYDRLLVGVRRTMGVETIYRHEHPRRMLEALHNNRVLGFAVDQAIEDVDAIRVDFFGRPAWSPVAPVRFARVTGAPLIPAFIIRQKGKHHIVYGPPIDLVDTGNRKADIQTNTQKWASVQEDYIRRYPHLWVWNHRRWKDV